jgi:beta-lactam-binding protein with PASTA domain
MAFNSFFKGKSGRWFWFNICLMLALIVAIPTATIYLLDQFTHHGEKIEVPSVVGKSFYDAEQLLKDRDLLAMVSDSVYNKYAAPGAVLEQSPKAGYEVKGGRVVYLTVNYVSEPMAKLPDVVSHGSLREAEALLQSQGFKLTPHKLVMGSPKDLVLGVKQGGRDVHAGEMIPRTRMLTLVVGGGEVDSLAVEREDMEAEALDQEGDGKDFDIEL